jgi:hypothetical protein
LGTPPAVGQLLPTSALSASTAQGLGLTCLAFREEPAAADDVRRHGGRIAQVVILEIDVPGSWRRRSKKGLWYCPGDVPPERIRGMITFGELSRSPAEEAAAAGR